MKIIPAAEILSKTEFNNQTDWENYPTADYCCDKCSQTISIDFKSLRKHQFSDFSNLDIEDQKQFMDIEKAGEKTNSFLDFYCPTCKRPVKIYYDSWAGGRHTEAGFKIVFIIQ